MADSTATGQQPAPSKEFAFTPEQEELRTAVRRFCADHCDKATVRRLMESAPPFDPKAWSRLGSELGVLGLGVPEELGGAGGGIVDAAILADELGAALFRGPVLGTLALSVPALVAAPDTPARTEILGPLVEGARTAAFAVPDQAGRFTADSVTVRASGTGGNWTVSGTVERVVDAGTANDLLVAATGPDGVALFAVDASAPGVERTALSTMDQTRPQALIRFAGAPARLLAGPEEAARVCQRALHAGSVLLAAEQAGGAQHLLDRCVTYARERLQFGRPIGSFQAVKHRLANMVVELEHARSVAYHGAWALQEGTDDPALVASIAQATCSDAFVLIAADAIQVHGGIGFTWEHPAHVYFKRAFTDAALLGCAEEHRARIAELVLDTAPADQELAVVTGLSVATWGPWYRPSSRRSACMTSDLPQWHLLKAGSSTMTELTEKQLEVVNAHAAAEFANDLEATMATVCEHPWYELVGLGLLLEGREAVREWYRRTLPSMTERAVAGEPRIDGIAPDTMMSEYYVSVTIGGVVTKCRCLAVISLEGDLFKGERIYSDPFLSELWVKDLGDDFVKVPGVTRV